jgi:hypothetical protein
LAAAHGIASRAPCSRGSAQVDVGRGESSEGNRDFFFLKRPGFCVVCEAARVRGRDKTALVALCAVSYGLRVNRQRQIFWDMLLLPRRQIIGDGRSI